MSHSPFTLAPAITQRIAAFAEEIREAAQQAAFLMENTPERLENKLLDEVRLCLEGLSSPLLEAIAAEEDEDREVYPLPQPAPYFLPLALGRVAALGRVFPLLASLACGLEGGDRLALEYFAGRIDYLSNSAGYLRETVMEELPPLEAFDKVSIPAAYA